MKAYFCAAQTRAAQFAFGFASGSTWGLHELLTHDYATFKAFAPRANDQFWNPAISWKNKYHSRLPDHITDAKHILFSANQVFMFGGGISIVIGEKLTLRKIITNTAIFSAGYVIGNNLTFTLPRKLH